MLLLNFPILYWHLFDIIYMEKGWFTSIYVEKIICIVQWDIIVGWERA